MNKAIRFILILLSVATGALFVYSAYTKLFPTIQAFEYNIAGQLHVRYLTAAIAARFFIALEAALGSLIALHFFGGGKWVLKAALGLIVIFSIYLVWLWIKMGNDVNCGCFGDSIFMRPSASLLKNGAMLLVLWLLIRYHTGFTRQWARIIPPIHMLCIFALAFIIFPVFRQYTLNFKNIYADAQYAPTEDLSHGKHIIAFLSRSCMHCRRTALKMHQMKQSNPTLPFFLIIGGTDTALTDFWNYSHAQDIPHMRMTEKPFLDYTGGEFPQIIWVNDGKVEANTTYPELDQKVIEKWMKP